MNKHGISIAETIRSAATGAADRKPQSRQPVDMQKKKNARRIPAALLFLAPGILGFVLFYIGPFLLSLGYAFLDRPVNGRFVGIANFADLLGSKAYRTGLGNTLRFIGISVPLNMGVSLAAALLLRGQKRHREWFTLLFLIPLVIPSGSMVSFWKAVFREDGVIDAILHSIGAGGGNWLNTQHAMLVMVAIFIWKNMGYNMVLFLSGLSSVPKENYEAAKVDGAGPWRSFVSITLPGLAPTSILVATMSIVNSFKVFKEIYLITGNYPHESIYTLQHFMNNMFSSLNYPRLTTATTLLVVLIALFTQGLLILERRTAP